MVEQMRKSAVILSAAGSWGLISIWTDGQLCDAIRGRPGVKKAFPLGLERAVCIMETIALHDEVWYAPDRDPFDRVDLSESVPWDIKHDPVLTRALDEGILRILDRDAINRLGGEQGIDELAKAAQMRASTLAFKLALFHPEYKRLLQHLVLSDMLGLRLIAMPDMEAACAKITTALFLHPIMQSGLRDVYTSMSDGMKEQVSTLLREARGATVTLPPISALVLSDAGRPENIASSLLSLHAKLGGIRKAFAEYDVIVRSDDVALDRRIKAHDKLTRIANDLAAPYKSKDVTMISEWRDLFDLIDYEALTEGKIVRAFVGKPLEFTCQFLSRLRVLHLYGLKRQFFKLRRYRSLVPDVFGVTISDEDIAYCTDLVLRTEWNREEATAISQADMSILDAEFESIVGESDDSSRSE